MLSGMLRHCASAAPRQGRTRSRASGGGACAKPRATDSRQKNAHAADGTPRARATHEPHTTHSAHTRQQQREANPPHLQRAPRLRDGVHDDAGARRGHAHHGAEVAHAGSAEHEEDAHVLRRGGGRHGGCGARRRAAGACALHARGWLRRLERARQLSAQNTALPSFALRCAKPRPPCVVAPACAAVGTTPPPRAARRRRRHPGRVFPLLSRSMMSCPSPQKSGSSSGLLLDAPAAAAATAAHAAALLDSAGGGARAAAPAGGRASGAGPPEDSQNPEGNAIGDLHGAPAAGAPPPPPAAALAPAEGTPAAPGALVGRRVVRRLGGAPYEGVVSSWRATAAHGALWRVSYDDGDREDLNWDEMQAALLPPPAAAGSGGTAGGGAAAAGNASHEEDDGGAAAPAPADDDDDDGARRYKGVRRSSTPGCSPWMYSIMNPATKKKHTCARFRSAIDAARAYDERARALGITAVNFPRAGSDEVQDHYASGRYGFARPGGGGGGGGGIAMAAQAPAQAATAMMPRRQPSLRRQRAAAARGAGGAAAQRDASSSDDDESSSSSDDDDDDGDDDGGGGRAPPASTFYGVHPSRGGRFVARLRGLHMGTHRSAKAAARVVDARTRAAGLLHLINFPETEAERAAVAAHAAAAAAAAEGKEEEEEKTPAAAARGGARKRAREPSPNDDGGAAAAAAASPALATPAAAPRGLAAQPGSGALALTPPATAAALTAPAPAHAAVDAAADASRRAAVAEVAAFLRGITPPLSCLPAALAALPHSGVSMAHLAAVAAAAVPRHADRAMIIGTTADAMHISKSNPFDRISFVAALLALVPRGGGGASGERGERATRWLL
jgi:hypothetical protein